MHTSNIRSSSTKDLFDDDLADAVAIVEAHAARDALDVDVLDDVEEFGAPARLSPDRIELKVVGTVVEFFKRGRESEQSIECVAEKVVRRRECREIEFELIRSLDEGVRTAHGEREREKRTRSAIVRVLR